MDSSYKFPKTTRYESMVNTFYFAEVSDQRFWVAQPLPHEVPKILGPLWRKSLLLTSCSATHFVNLLIPDPGTLKNWALWAYGQIEKSASCLKVSWKGRILLAKKESEAWDFPVGRKLVVKVGGKVIIKNPPNARPCHSWIWWIFWLKW